ncbi:MAG: hypothetical protein K1X36_01600 [Pyrinomonadaceae bacterium]|nr:hypothetical protein [Pyrinomonadaceae bacterium]
MKINKIVAVLFLISIWSIAGFAQETPSELRDLIGARGSSGETALQKRGYKFVKTTEGSDRKWSNWWKSSSKTCITVATVDGRYDSIVSSSPLDCNQNANGGGSESTGSDPSSDYSDLIGAKGSSGEAELERRGYKFIKTTEGGDRKWSNWWKASPKTCLTVATVNGRFDSIVAGSELDCKAGGNSSSGGSSAVDLKDLVGSRAAGAETEIEGRGFRNVKSNKSGSASFTFWKNDDTGQCVMMTVRNGKVSSIVKSNDPACR